MSVEWKTSLATYNRAESAFFGNITEEQWAFVDGWATEKNSFQQFLESLNEVQESLALVWSMRLRELIEHTITSKALADTTDEPVVIEQQPLAL